MAWATIRKATTEDNARLIAAARRFATRHGLLAIDGSMVMGVEMAVDDAAKGHNGDGGALRRLWLRCVRRALRNQHAEGIAYGYVGYVEHEG